MKASNAGIPVVNHAISSHSGQEVFAGTGAVQGSGPGAINGAVCAILAAALPAAPAHAGDSGVPQQLQAIQTQLQELQNTINGIVNGTTQVATSGRRYYLTKDSFDGSSTLTACAPGFHFASPFEIFNTSSLVYDTTPGGTNDDSGSGPPAGFFGWVRSGGNSTNALVRDCKLWTSNGYVDYGIGAEIPLGDTWYSNSDVTSPWNAVDNLTCGFNFGVWCVEN